MEDSAEMKMVKSMLRSVLISSKEGVPAFKLQRDYKEIVGEFIPFKKFGHSNFESFISSVPDVVRIERRGGDIVLHAVADQSTAHIQKLVSKQKGKKLKKPSRRPRGDGNVYRFLPRTPGRAPPRPQRTAHMTTPNHHQRYGMPTFISPPQAVYNKPLTPLLVKVGNSNQGSRTIMLRPNNLLKRAVNDAATDRSRQNKSDRFEMPPRFRRAQDQSKGMGGVQVQNIPVKRPTQQYKDFATLENPNSYIEELDQYVRELGKDIAFNTTSSHGGFVSSVQINNDTFGSVDTFQTRTEAEGAAALKAITGLNLRERQGELGKEDVCASLPADQKLLIKCRVREILMSKRNGLWGTRIPYEYKEKYKEEAPADLIKMIKSWTDIAKVEFVPNTERDIVYPVIQQEDNSAVSKKNCDINATTARSVEKPEPVKDLYNLHVQTKNTQAGVMQKLVIPREMLTGKEEIVVYMTHIDCPSAFYVQLEDSVIDEIAEKLQIHCKSQNPVDPKSIEAGQCCAGLFSGDKMWTRAEIWKLKEEDKVELLFVDYGNREDVHMSNIRWLSPSLAEYPCQAIMCNLHNVMPLEGELEWSTAATEKFASIVQEQALVGIPIYISDDDVTIDLHLKSDPSMKVREQMIQAGVVRPLSEQGQTQNQDDLHPVDLVLPADKLWDVHVTYISSSLGSVMVRLVGEDYSDKLDGYQSILQEAFHSNYADGPISEGMTYVAMDDDLYHRVRVISINDTKVQCYFLDHGDTDELPLLQLHSLNPDINKKLPYQAVEMSMYGLDDVYTNITALERMCELALGKTCVAEAIERDDIPAVVLYDTSGDIDVNINETILRVIKAEGGGIDSPRDISPSPATSNSATPARVPSPVPMTSSPEQVAEHRTLSTDSAERQLSVTSNMPSTNNNSSSLQSRINDININEKINLNENTGQNVNNKNNVSLQQTQIANNNYNDAKTTNNYPASPGASTINQNLAKTPEKQTNSLVPDNMSVQPVQIQRSPMLSTGTISVERVNTSSNVIETTGASGVSGHKTVACDIPEFVIPPTGEYLDVHVNFIHDPSNFVCIPYSEMGRLNTLLLEMLNFYSADLPTIRKDDMVIGKIYAGNHDDIWYRVRISNFVTEDLVSVYEVDIGEYNILEVTQIRELADQFKRLPMMAFKASLASLIPESGMWYEAAKYKFIELARDQDLVALILGHDAENSVSNVRLVDTSTPNNDICIDEILVKMGYATFA